MADHDDKGRLEMISTSWTLLDRAHQGADDAGMDAVAQAQAQLLERYGGAVRRYLLGSLKDAEAADDLFQEFAVSFSARRFPRRQSSEGAFPRFPQGGRIAHGGRPLQTPATPTPGTPEKFPEPAAPAVPLLDELFQESWRDELLAKTWLALGEMERTTGQPFHSVLRFRADHPRAAFRGPGQRPVGKAAKTDHGPRRSPTAASGKRKVRRAAQGQSAGLTGER